VIKTDERGQSEPGVVTAQAAPVDSGADCRWLMVAAQTAGLASGNLRLSGNPARDRGYLLRIATRTPGTGPNSVGLAREFARATLQRWGVAERSEDIAIVISELLTNALRHALPQPGHTRPIRLGLLQPGRCLLCAVTDPSSAAPILQAPPEFLPETGRGLRIICALSDRWGYTTLSDTGKVVWATFT
jgi:anti-sigma regulatory factor (Ser/Thr protein kinase)